MSIQKKRRSFWSCISPIFIYYLCQIVAYLIMGVIYSAKIVKKLDFNQTYEQLIESMTEQLNGDMGVIYYASMLLAAIIALPILFRMFKKDSGSRKLVGKEIIYKSIPYQWYLIPIFMGIGAAIAGNNMITMSGIATSSESFSQTNEILFSGSFELQILGIGILIPIVEEILFRGVIYKRMGDIMPVIQASISSAFVFGLLHGNFVQGIYGFCMGILLCLVYERFHNLAAPILMHIAANLIVVLGSGTSILDVFYSSVPMFYGFTAVMCLVIIGTVWALEAYVRPINENVEQSDDNDYESE